MLRGLRQRKQERIEEERDRTQDVYKLLTISIITMYCKHALMKYISKNTDFLSSKPVTL